MQPFAKKSKRVSLSDIAQLAGVSTATVSRVLGGQSGPSETTRKSVLETADRLGYAPNVIARAMSTRRSKLIGIVVADLEDPFFVEVLDGAYEQASKHGYHLLVASSRRDPRVEKAIIEDFHGYCVDGILLAGTPHRDLDAELSLAQTLSALNAESIHIIQLGLRRFPIPLFRVDFASIAADATRHLLALGHRRISYISDAIPMEIRELHNIGMARAMGEVGVAFDPSLMLEWNKLQHTELLRELLESGVTAVLGADDSTALSIMFSLQNLKIKVPRDLSVMGMDGTQLATQLFEPALSTVALPIKSIGAQAIAEIVRVAGGGNQRDELVLPHQLVPRESTASPGNLQASRSLMAR
ncbi:LacI family DNA-binding transcriptional regulator [Limibacillus sp. MBR-115]|jgi:LacI family transcriptional regulator|uniref:LacI family DNA-binding transcriptional regulator n=1 Tax=Limibacillus sp. MBR-115 TaxID=3156465 RepID=UPI00339228D2